MYLKTILYFLFLMLLFVFLPKNSNAQDNLILLCGEQKYENLGKKIEIFYDSTRNCNFQSILDVKQQKKFVPLGKDNANFGYDKNTAFWFKLRVKKCDSLVKDWILEFPFPLIDTVEVFFPDKARQNYTKTGTGSLMPHETRYLKHTGIAFPMNFHDTEEHIIYMRITNYSSLLLAFNFSRSVIFHENNRNKDFWYGIFSGVMCIMFFYNLTLFFSTRNKSYFFYILSIFCTLLTFTIVGGYVFKYISTDFYLFNRYILRLSMLGIGIATSAFTLSFLDLKKYVPILNKVVWVHLFIGFFGVFLVLLPQAQEINFVSKIANTYISITVFILLTCGVWSMAKGNEVARFYTASWFFYVIGGLFATLRNMGVLPFNTLTTHSAELGAIFEVFFISIALGDRYRIIRREKDEAQKQTLEVQRLANEQLEKKVLERTQQFLEANEELQQTVEELDSTNESLNELNDSLNIQKAIIEKKNEDITASITYAARIQKAILPDAKMLNYSFGNAFLFFRPRDIVSGDFYWTVEKNGVKLLAVADCTGHGVPGSLMSMIGVQLLNSIVFEKNITETNLILSVLSKEIRSVLRQEETNSQDGMDIALISLQKLENDTILVQYSGAMNPLYYAINGVFSEIKADKKSIGGRQYGENDFTKHQFLISKEENANLYLFSDGFQDQFGGENNKKYLVKRFRNLIAAMQNENLTAQASLIEKEFDTWKGENRQLDDVLVLGVQINLDLKWHK